MTCRLLVPGLLCAWSGLGVITVLVALQGLHSGLIPTRFIFLFIFSLVCITLVALGGTSDFYDGWHDCVQQIATGQRHGTQRAARHHGDATRNAWLSDSAFSVQITHLSFFSRDTLELSRFYFVLLGYIPKLQIIVFSLACVHS